MEARTEIRSKNAHHIILSYKGALYYVNRVSVRFCEGERVHKAIFHAKRVIDNQPEDLDLKITRKLYDILVEYTKLDNSDLMFLLHAENNELRWYLTSENRLRQHTTVNNANKYVV